MRKRTVLFAFLSMVLAPRFAQAADYTPAWAPGGWRYDTVLHAPNTTLDGKTIQAWAQSIDANTTASENAVPQKWIGQKTTSSVTGVGPLDSNGFASAPFDNGGNRIGDWASTVTPDWFSQGYDANLMGGYEALGSNYRPRSLFLQTDPYSNYAPGCGFILAMQGAVGSSQFPISQADFRAGASSVVTAAGYDTVASCILTGNQPARFVLTASSYTATSVVLSTALTAAQASMIFPGMYITTNSPNTDLSLTTTTGELPPKNLYAGFVSAQPSAGDTSISVYAWDVPGYGTGVSGQVPQTTTLDTVWSKRTSPTVWLGGGSGNSSFQNNWFAQVDVNNLTPSATNQSLIHQITPLEIDLNLVNGTAPDNSIDWQGISLNAGNQPAALTTNSRQLFLGGNINHHLITNGGCGNWDIESWADGGFIEFPSLCNIEAGSSVTEQVDASWTNWIGSANKMTTMIWTGIGNTSASTGWQQAVTHLGVTVDGNRVQTGDYGGSKQGDIEWNAGANYGSISLCGYGTNCGYRLNGDGTSFFSANAYMGNGFELVFFPATSGVAAPYLIGSGVSELSVLSNAGGYGSLKVGSTTISGNLTASGSVTATGSVSTAGFDLTGTGYVEAGNTLYLKPETVSNSLNPGLKGVDSYTIGVAANTSANIGILASTIQAFSGGTSAEATAARSVLEPDGNGNWSVSNSGTNVTSGQGGAMRMASYTLSALPTTNNTAGNQLWCSDCVLNGITGVAAYWHSDAAKWTDSQNGTLVN